MMSRFWELLEQSIIVQSLITVLVVGVYVYLVATGQTPQQDFYSILIMVISFWMGSKAGSAQATKGTIEQVKGLLGRRSDD